MLNLFQHLSSNKGIEDPEISKALVRVLTKQMNGIAIHGR